MPRALLCAIDGRHVTIKALARTVEGRARLSRLRHEMLRIFEPLVTAAAALCPAAGLSPAAP